MSKDLSKIMKERDDLTRQLKVLQDKINNNSKEFQKIKQKITELEQQLSDHK